MIMNAGGVVFGIVFCLAGILFILIGEHAKPDENGQYRVLWGGSVDPDEYVARVVIVVLICEIFGIILLLLGLQAPG
jgi:uncharacterized membrane protein YphA (DoxX/SURF4 family)